MPDWLTVTLMFGGLLLILFGLCVALSGFLSGSGLFQVSGVVVIVVGFAAMAIGSRGLTNEECAVVGTNADDATYVCVEVTE